MRYFWLAIFALLPTGAVAQEFQPVADETRFVELVAGKNLSRFGVSLRVSPQGTIQGRAFGYKVTGNWRWQNGYFCRSMEYGSGSLPDNCQAVLERGNTLRFISDRGAGDQADLRLR